MNCPQCQGLLAVYCYPRTKVFIDKYDNVIDSDQEEGYTWDESSKTECIECNWKGVVNETGSEEGE